MSTVKFQISNVKCQCRFKNVKCQLSNVKFQILNFEFKAVQNAVTLFEKFCHARWDQLKTEATKEGLILNSFLELVTDSRAEPG